jgi:hypothetical protein
LSAFSARGKAAAARKMRMIPTVTSHLERIRCPRTPITKPATISDR